MSKAEYPASSVTFAGELTVRTVAVAHEQIAEALRQSDTVLLNFDDVGEIDLSFIQLVEVARRAASDAGQSLALAAPADGALRQILQRGGFVGPGSADRVAFWLHGDLAQ